jgi:hypothetical protein
MCRSDRVGRYVFVVVLSQSNMMTYIIIVAARKHALSPDEGPTTVEELGACALSGILKPVKRAKAGGKLLIILGPNYLHLTVQKKISLPLS